MTNVTSNYEENRMSPFDLLALEKLLSTFERNDLVCLEIGSWFGAGSTQVIGKYSEELVCVDHWKGNDNEEHKRIVESTDVYNRFLANTSQFKHIIQPIVGSSHDICTFLTPNSLK